VAIITGKETMDELLSLADDMLLYFGMGCRSVSKLYIPVGYDLKKLINNVEKFEYYRYHNKYRNNYDYFKSIYIINKVSFIDTGDLILTENSSLSSPVSVVFYQYYEDLTALSEQITEMEGQLQSIVCHKRIKDHWILPGRTQYPELWDYADHLDTIDFLLDLSTKV
jgi:hypothetical protein